MLRLSAQNVDTILDSVVNTIGSVYIYDDFKRIKRILTLTSYNFCISTPLSKLDVTLFVKYNR